MSQRVFAIGDIHGCHDALLGLVEYVELGDDDLLITLGDYVDRGPKSREVVQWLIDRKAKGGLVTVRGNHDLMMCAAYREPVRAMPWLSSGGDRTLESYESASNAKGFAAVPSEHLEFLDGQCVPYHETESHIFVHAGVDPALELAEQDPRVIYWDRITDRGPHCSGKTVICGHSAQSSGLPLDLGHTVCIDTRVYGRGSLTCLEVATGDFWQCRQDGARRKGKLDEVATSAC